MDWPEIEVGQGSEKFNAIVQSNENDEPHTKGGIIKNGEWAWLASGCTLKIVSLRNGFTVSSFIFSESDGYKDYYIKCVNEVIPAKRERLLMLAVCLDSVSGICSSDTTATRSLVALYSVEDSCVLTCFEMRFHVSSACFMSSNACKRSLLKDFDGCLALGTEEGAVVLVNLNISRVIAMHEERQCVDNSFTPCHVVDFSLRLPELLRHIQKCQNDDLHFGLLIELMETPSPVLSILPIGFIFSLAIGLEDGRLVLYDLTEMQIFYIAMPKLQQYQQSDQQILSPLVKLDFMVPIDDPRACLYIWALHENEHNLTAVLHQVMYDRRLLDDNGELCCMFDTFINSKICLQLTLEQRTKSIAIACQSISNVSSTGDGENDNCLCVFGWHVPSESKNKIVIFDLNQWYKDEFPDEAKINVHSKCPNFLAAYTLSGQHCGLHVFVNPSTIANFQSNQRCEEHFYPNALSFDCRLLLTDSYRSYSWVGAQNRVINILRTSNAAIFLRPEFCFKEILRTHLLPQFTDLNSNATFSTQAKYKILLSVALEYNCYSLLRDCAKSWGDGSFACDFTATASGLSLSTLTEWIWEHATNIKLRCNELCKGVFDFAGYPLDEREQKEFAFLTQQLKLLANLLEDVMKFSKRNIPDEVFTDLSSKETSLRIAVSYQEILSWLINIGLLPEASPHNSKVDANVTLVPYPYAKLRAMYAQKRAYFSKISEKLISRENGSCEIIYIDALIEHESNGNVLREFWSENNGDGLYPPTSIEALLRVMLVPNLHYDLKCAILLYFFLDFDMSIDKAAYQKVITSLLKFPSVFKLPKAVITTVEAFWHLDHGNFLTAVDKFVSPFNYNKDYPQWLVELLVEALLTQKADKLALRIFQTRPLDIGPVLKIKTLLANEQFPEAFLFARTHHSEKMLEFFFIESINRRQFSVVRDLMLSEKEGQLLQRILKRSNTQCAENLHFVYLLQKSKYIEAVSYMDDLSKSPTSSLLKSNSGERSDYASANKDTPNLVLSAFNATMAPVTQGLTDVYFRIRNKISKKEARNDTPVPFSCQLIKHNANNLLGGIYQSSALSTHFATNYWGDEQSQKQRDGAVLLSAHNAPFLRAPQNELNQWDFIAKHPITYATPYKPPEKRVRCDESEPLENNPKKKRRILGLEILDDSQAIKQNNKTLRHLNPNDFSFAETNAQREHRLMTQPLSTPRKNSEERNIGRNAEIHSILKAFTPEPEDGAIRHRSALPMDEEKSIRFKMQPVYENDSDNEISAAEPIESSPICETATDDIASAQVKASNENVVQIRKEFTRTISMDSSNSSDSSSSDSISNDNNVLSSTKFSKVQNKETLNSSVTTSSDADAVAENNENKQLFTDSTITPTSVMAVTPIARKPINSGQFSVASDLMLSEKDGQHQQRTFSERIARKPLIRSAPEPFDPLQKEKEHSLIPIVPTVSETVLEPNSELKSHELVVSSATSVMPCLQISSVVSLSSKINEFQPPICSSKLGAMQSKVTKESIISKVKLSERSTIDGSLNFGETIEGGPLNTFVGSNNSEEHLQATKTVFRHMLDTTLDMSTYDYMATDEPISISMQQQAISSSSVLAETEMEEEYSTDETSNNDDASVATDNDDASVASENDDASVASENDEAVVATENNAASNASENDAAEHNVQVMPESAASKDDTKIFSNSKHASSKNSVDEDVIVLLSSSSSTSSAADSDSDNDASKDINDSRSSEIEFSGINEESKLKRFKNADIVDLSSSENYDTDDESDAEDEIMNELVLSRANANKNIEAQTIMEDQHRLLVAQQQLYEMDTNPAAESIPNIYVPLESFDNDEQFLQSTNGREQSMSADEEHSFATPDNREILENFVDHVVLDESFKSCKSNEVTSTEHSFIITTIEDKLSTEIVECPLDELPKTNDEAITSNSERILLPNPNASNASQSSPNVCIVAEAQASNSNENSAETGDSNVDESFVDSSHAVAERYTDVVLQANDNSKAQLFKEDLSVIVDEIKADSTVDETSNTFGNNQSVHVDNSPANQTDELIPVSVEITADSNVDEIPTVSGYKPVITTVATEMQLESFLVNVNEASEITADEINLDSSIYDSSIATEYNLDISSADPVIHIASSSGNAKEVSALIVGPVNANVNASIDETPNAGTITAVPDKSLNSEQSTETSKESEINVDSSVGATPTVSENNQDVISSVNLQPEAVAIVTEAKEQKTLNEIADEVIVDSSLELPQESQVTEELVSTVNRGSVVECQLDNLPESNTPVAIVESSINDTQYMMAESSTTSELDYKYQSYLAVKRKTNKRGISVPTQSLGESIEKDITARTFNRLRAASEQTDIRDSKENISSKREKSMSPPVDETTNLSELDSNKPSCSKQLKKKNQRVDEPRAIIRKRASSVQPVSLEEEKPSVEKQSTRKVRRGLRQTSMPPEDLKVYSASPIHFTRQKLSHLDVTEDPASSAGSPSSRTRSRTRLSSFDNEVEISITDSQTPVKRKRYSSLSSAASEPKSTPTGKKRPQSVTKMALKGAELDALLDNNDSSFASNETTSQSPKSPSTTNSINDYSATRRLTRAQQAMLDKSIAIADAKILSPIAKRSTQQRRHSNVDDDIESISSRISSTYSDTTKRRLTRSSVKDQHEEDDDRISVASSNESRTRRKTKISKLLSVIPENESETESSTQSKIRKRQAKK